MATTLSAVAFRLGLKIGLDRGEDLDGLSLFEQEMRVRLWWQICTQDVLARHLFSSKDIQDGASLIPHIRLPLNINDAELHPDMAKEPTDIARASEMVYVLMKYEGIQWAQSQRTQRQQTKPLTKLDFEELQKILYMKYIMHCDSRIPLHAAAQTLAESSIRIVSYMKNRMQAEGGVPSDELFELAIEVLEIDRANRKLPFATQLIWHGGPVQIDALVHILMKLRQVVAGDAAAKGWDLVANFWTEQNDGDWEGDATFFDKLADLTLEAWNERRKELLAVYGPSMIDSLTLPYIKRFQEARGSRHSNAPTEFGYTAQPVSLQSTSSGDLNPQAMFDMGAENVWQEWLNSNNDMYYSLGYWPDFSLL